jgi:hypothetical protein
MSDAVELLSGPLRTERMKDGRRSLLRDLEAKVEGETIVVPEGSVTDFSSIPWFGRFLVRWSRVDLAGVVHDRLYQDGNRSRAYADRVWRLVARAGERRANALQAWIGWFALRVGGWMAWNRYRRRDSTGQGSGES